MSEAEQRRRSPTPDEAIFKAKSIFSFVREAYANGWLKQIRSSESETSSETSEVGLGNANLWVDFIFNSLLSLLYHYNRFTPIRKTMSSS